MLSIGGQKVPARILYLMGSDALSVVIGLVIATIIRFHESHLVWAYLRTGGSIWKFLIITCVCLASFHYNDLYDPQVVRRTSEFVLRLLQAYGFVCVLLAILFYFVPWASVGRGIVILGTPSTLFLLVVWRLVMHDRQFVFGAPERVLVVGTGPSAVSLVREIIARPELDCRVIGFLDESRENVGKSLVNPGIIAAIEDIEQVVADRGIQRVILSLSERRGKTPIRQLLRLKFEGVQIEDAHSFQERITGRIPLEYLSPSWLILSEGFRKSAVLRALKRAIDIVVSLVVLVVTLPIMGLVAIAVALESGMPILFRQERVGLGGRSFQILKFRSMRQDAEAHGPSWAAANDHRITRVGWLLRTYRLDELPQLWNVLKGEMSLIGPRPERPHFCKLLEESTPFYSLRHSVRPGITGWAQIKYQYGASVEESKTKLEYDIFYIKHLSIPLDFAIFFETAKVMIYGRGAK
jgi:sugar transferase (PEP-CTERM system associated)